MERPNNIDELMRQRLQQAEVPPPAFVWENVERHLQRRKRRFFLWFFAACLASVSIWALWQRPGLPVLPEPDNTMAAPQPATPSVALPETGEIPSPVPAAAVNPAPATAENYTAPSGNATRKAAPATTVTTAQQRQTSARAVGPTPAQATVLAEPVVREEQARASETTQPTGLFRTMRTTTADFLPGRLTALSSEPLPPVFPVVPPPQTPKKTPRKCYDFHSNRQAWLIDVYAGPSLIHKQLYSGDPEFKDYVQDRNQTEKREWAFNGGVRASYLFAENFLVRTGLHVDHFVEQFEYIDPNFIKYTVVITQKLVNGQWVTVPDTVNVEYGANYQKTYNRFTLLDIPLQAALELRSGPTGISLNLGGSINLLFRKQGSMLTLDGKPASFTPGDQQYDVFRPRVGLSLLGSIQWFYHITPRTRAFAEPYYRRILDPVTRSGYPAEQSYGVGGLRLGITQILN